MKRFVGILLVAVAVAVLPALASTRQTGAAKAQAGTTPKTLSTMGTVTAVATDSLTVKTKSGEMKFAIDNKTSVTAKGATTKTLALKADGKKPVLPDFVKVGELVTVNYRETGATRTAETIRVTAQVK